MTSKVETINFSFGGLPWLHLNFFCILKCVIDLLLECFKIDLEFLSDIAVFIQSWVFVQSLSSKGGVAKLSTDCLWSLDASIVVLTASNFFISMLGLFSLELLFDVIDECDWLCEFFWHLNWALLLYWRSVFLSFCVYASKGVSGVARICLAGVDVAVQGFFFSFVRYHVEVLLF